MDAPVAVQQRFCVRIFLKRLLEGVQHKRCIIAAAQGERNDIPSVQIQHSTQVCLAARAVFEFCYVSHPFLILPVRRKLPVQNIFRGVFRRGLLLIPPLFLSAYLSCYDLNEQKINHAYQPLIGRVHFINGDAQQFTDAKAYLDCIREELPHDATTGFRFRTITQDPAICKAVDDIVFDFYGEENPCSEEDYNLAPSEEIQMGGM